MKRKGEDGREERKRENNKESREKEMDINIESDHTKTAVAYTFALIWNSSCSMSRSSAVSTEVPRSIRL